MYGLDVVIDLTKVIRSFPRARTGEDESHLDIHLDIQLRFGTQGHDLEHDEANSKRNLVVLQLNLLLKIYDMNV